jgi:hypothetical protein
VLAWLGRLWEAVKEVGRIAWPMRFSVLLVAIAGPFLLLPQSQDALLALTEADDEKPQLLFALVVFVWAFYTHYWARFMSRLEARPLPPPRWPPSWLYGHRIEWLNLWIPRVLGALAIVIVWLAIERAADHWLAVGWPFALGLVVYWVAVIYRRPMMARLGAQIADDRFVARDIARGTFDAQLGLQIWRWLLFASLAVTFGFFLVSAYTAIPEGQAAWTTSTLAAIGAICAIGLLSQIRRLPIGTRYAVAISLVLVCLLFLASINSTVVAGQWLASPSIVMTVAAAWVSLGTFAIAFPGEILRLPVGAAIIGLALLFSVIGSRDNHGLRLLTSPPTDSETISAALQRWYGGGHDKAALEAWQAGAQRAGVKVPLVIVATAGGASRAGLWTAKVLGELQDNHPEFHNYLFAISGISGGSYGAAVYRALLSQADAHPGRPLERPKCTDGFEVLSGFVDCARAVIKQDFLGPAFLTGLYADLTQRFLPGALLPDRATALELSWDRAWDRSIAEPHVKFSDGFHQFWRNRSRWFPSLLLNGTSAKQGRRIVTSNLSIEDATTVSRFADTLDFFGRVKREISLSTAAHNSARFPYIDAAGTIWTDHVKNDRIIDGGYFENFGAQTAHDLVLALADLRAAGGVNAEFVFVVIQISSDPGLELDSPRNDAWKAPMDAAINFAADIATPLAGFWDVREGHGVAAADALAGPTPDIAHSDGSVDHPYYVHFRLTDQSTPMSWALSNRSVQQLSAEWDSPINKAQRAALDWMMCWNPAPSRCQPTR